MNDIIPPLTTEETARLRVYRERRFNSRQHRAIEHMAPEEIADFDTLEWRVRPRMNRALPSFDALRTAAMIERHTGDEGLVYRLEVARLIDIDLECLRSALAAEKERTNNLTLQLAVAQARVDALTDPEERAQP